MLQETQTFSAGCKCLIHLKLPSSNCSDKNHWAWMQKSMVVSAPGQDDPLLVSEHAIVVEGLEGLGGRVAERLGPKVELTLLERHEAGCCKETAPANSQQCPVNVNLPVKLMLTLRTGCCQLFFHLHTPNLFHWDQYPYGTGSYNSNHVMWSCPLTFNALMSDTAQSDGCPHQAVGTGGNAVATANLILHTRLKI